MSIRTVGFVFGVAFGLVLGWARLTDYDFIRDMLLLRDADVFLLMMSAMATAAVGVRVLRKLQVRTVLDQTLIAWTTQSPRRQHLVGGVVFGIGWSIAGSCPGPVAAQLGRGQLASVFTISGMLMGIAIYDHVGGRRESAVTRPASRDAATIAGL